MYKWRLRKRNNKKKIDKVKSEGDTLGGVVEIRVKNLIPGLVHIPNLTKNRWRTSNALNECTSYKGCRNRYRIWCCK